MSEWKSDGRLFAIVSSLLRNACASKVWKSRTDVVQRRNKKCARWIHFSRLFAATQRCRVCAVQTESLYLWRRDKRDANKWNKTSTRELENQNIVAIASLCQRDRQISPKHFRVSVGQCWMLSCQYMPVVLKLNSLVRVSVYCCDNISMRSRSVCLVGGTVQKSKKWLIFIDAGHFTHWIERWWICFGQMNEITEHDRYK